MNLFKMANSLILIATMTLSLQACQQSTSPQTTGEHAEDHQHEGHGSPHRHAEGEPPHEHAAEAAEGFVKVRDHQFKLAPDIGEDKVTHLDLYIHDTQNKPVPGAKILLHLTHPNGEKESLTLNEDENHYHTKTTLGQTGEYRAVAQVDINGQKFNPRFSFKTTE